jgi:2-iminobutanoate/2-iminopropanoate deaminase
MPRQSVMAAGATAPQGPYSQAIRAGDFLFLSGEGPLDAEGNVVGSGIAEQTRATMRNLAAILDVGGASFADVVKATVFLSTMNDYDEFNRAYGELVTEPFPARICVAAGGLWGGILVEIDVIAYCGS